MNKQERVFQAAFSVLGGATVIWMIVNIWAPLQGKDVCEWVTGFCFHSPYLIGLAVLLILWAIYRWMSETWNPLEIIRGKDNRWSTSKCQFFFWTVFALFSYVSVYAALVGAHHLLKRGEPQIPTNLLLAMGLSVTTALAAKGITVSQPSKDHVDDTQAALGNLVKDDEGEIDLTKVQMLGWTLIALGAYLGNTVHLVNLIEMANVPQDLHLPDIDTGLMVMMGLGQGAYLAKKLIASSTPVISKVDPASVPVGHDVTLKLTGSGFGVAKTDSSAINLDGVETNFVITGWKDSEITFTIPTASLAAAGQKKLSVTVSSQNSNSVPLTVT